MTIALILLAPLTVIAALVWLRSAWLAFALYHGLVCVVLPWVVARRGGATLRDHAASLGLRRAGIRLGLLLGLASGVAVVATFRWFAALLPLPQTTGAVLRAWGVTPGALPVLFAVMLPGNAAAEELFWRGWAQPRLAARWGAGAAIAVTAALYASYHAYTLAALAREPVAIVACALAVAGAGMFWGWLRARTGSLWPALLSHAGATAGYMFVLWRWVRAG